MPPFFMEPRAVDYPDYVKLYQSKYQELFQQYLSSEAKNMVMSEYVADLQALLVQLQEENNSLKSQLNKKAAPSRKKSAASTEESTFIDASGV